MKTLKNKKYTNKKYINRKNTKKYTNKKYKYKKKHLKGGATNIYQSNHIKDILNYIKSIAIDNNLDHELCGTIEIVKNRPYKYELILHQNSRTSSSTTRQMCNYENYSKIIWHTHPNISKFYPSLEDIEKVIKLRSKNIIKDSYIITSFGVWQLSSINNIDIDDIIKEHIQNILDELYFNTNNGRDYNENAINQAINELNSSYNNVLNIQFFKYPL